MGWKLSFFHLAELNFFHKWKLLDQLQTQDDETRLMAHAYP